MPRNPRTPETNFLDMGASRAAEAFLDRARKGVAKSAAGLVELIRDAEPIIDDLKVEGERIANYLRETVLSADAAHRDVARSQSATNAAWRSEMAAALGALQSAHMEAVARELAAGLDHVRDDASRLARRQAEIVADAAPLARRLAELVREYEIAGRDINLANARLRSAERFTDCVMQAHEDAGRRAGQPRVMPVSGIVASDAAGAIEAIATALR